MRLVRVGHLSFFTNSNKATSIFLNGRTISEKPYFHEKIVSQRSFCHNFGKKIESDLCVRVTKGRLIYNQMKRVQKNNQNGEKIEVLAVSNQKLLISGTSKSRRHSGRGGARKINFDFVFQIFCSEELFDRKC